MFSNSPCGFWHMLHMLIFSWWTLATLWDAVSSAMSGGPTPWGGSGNKDVGVLGIGGGHPEPQWAGTETGAWDMSDGATADFCWMSCCLTPVWHVWENILWGLTCVKGNLWSISMLLHCMFDVTAFWARIRESEMQRQSFGDDHISSLQCQEPDTAPEPTSHHLTKSQRGPRNPRTRPQNHTNSCSWQFVHVNQLMFVNVWYQLFDNVGISIFGDLQVSFRVGPKAVPPWGFSSPPTPWMKSGPWPQLAMA